MRRSLFARTGSSTRWLVLALWIAAALPLAHLGAITHALSHLGAADHALAGGGKHAPQGDCGSCTGYAALGSGPPASAPRAAVPSARPLRIAVPARGGRQVALILSHAPRAPPALLV